MNTFFPTLSMAFGGFGFGHDLVSDVGEAKTYLTGKNPYLPIVPQFGLISSVFSLALRIFESYKGVEAPLKVQLVCVVAPLCSLPFFGLVAALRDDQYGAMKGEWNKSLPPPLHLPEKLPEPIRRAVEFISEHTTEVVRVAAVVGLIALIPLGQLPYSLSAFSALAFDYVVRSGRVSSDLQIWAETYFPAITLVGNLLEGSLLTRLETLCWEPVGFAPDVTLQLQKRVDGFFKALFFFLNKPTLAQCDAPLQRPSEPTFEQMMGLIEKEEAAFSFNPAHFMKEVSDLYPLDTNNDYPLLLKLFDQVNWEEKYPLVLGILCDDDQFIGFLKEQFPQIDVNDFFQKTYPEGVVVTAQQRLLDRQALKNRIDGLIATLAVDQKVTKEVFAARYLRSLMDSFVKVMTGESTREGDKHHIQLARVNVQQLIPLLQSLQTPHESSKFVEHYDFVLEELMVNSSFQERLKLVFPEISPENFPMKTDECLSSLAQEAGLTKEGYAALAYVEYKNGEQNRAVEDCLLNLAVCGGYCTNELERETKKQKDALLDHRAVASGQTFEERRMGIFETNLLMSLVRARHRVLQSAYQEFIDFFMPGWSEKMRKSMHIELAFEKFFSLGFYPMSKHERSEITIVEFLLMEFFTNFVIGNSILERLFGSFFKDFEVRYRENIPEVFQEIRSDFNEYLTHFIRRRDLFTEKQQDDITELFIDPIKAKKMEEGFFRLTLYRLGILQLKIPISKKNELENPDQLPNMASALN